MWVRNELPAGEVVLSQRVVGLGVSLELILGKHNGNRKVIVFLSQICTFF